MRRRPPFRVEAAAAALLLAGLGGGCGGGEREAGQGFATQTGPEPTTMESPGGERDAEETPSVVEEDPQEQDEGGGEEESPPATTNEVVVGPSFAGGPEVDFGALEIGATSMRTITIRNFHDVARSIAALGIEGDHGSDFSIAGGDCRVDLELAPEEACSVDVAFTPAADGGRTAVLDIAVRPPAGRQVRLRGTGGVVPVTPDVPAVTDDQVLQP